MRLLWLDEIPANLRARVPRAPPVWVKPMLARLHEGPLPEGDWVFERKFDGQRVTVVSNPTSPRGLRLVSRNGIDVSQRYPEIVASLPKDRACVLDVELVAFDGERDSFPLLQKRMHSKQPDLRIPVHCLVFDCLNLDGYDTSALALRLRKGLLRRLSLSDRCGVVPHRTGDPVRLLQGACEADWEGLIAKQADAPYVSRRSGYWLKLKCLKSEAFRIGGYTSPKGARAGFGALLVGQRTGDGLRYAGKVGTGFDERELRMLHEGLRRIRRPDPPFLDPPGRPAQWVDPVLVCRVDYRERTPDGRLRHPRFVGLVDPDVRRVVH